MYLSKRSNGFYYVYYDKPDGKRTCISTKTKFKSEATKFLSKFEKELKQRSIEKNIPISLNELSEQFLEYSSTIHSPNHTKSIRTTFNELEKVVENPPLSMLRNAKVQNYFEDRLKKVSAYAVRRDIANLSSAFNWAIRKNYIDENPVKGIKKPKLPERLPYFFTEEQFEKLISVVDDSDLRDLFNFALLTGLRQSDLISLQWSQINFRDNTVILDNRNSLTKSWKVHSIPLNISALQILTERELKKKNELLVFTYKEQKIKQDFISKKFRKYVKKAGLNSKLTFHSLRHTFASWLIQRGASLYQVSKLMTHSDLRVTQIYSHLRSEDLRNSINLITIN
ncbi:MAG: site-specific integrase [Melioribacteraceae bacterium]|nr:MAG: site-specific integrase [Melioribacteraceae bacterium]